jgi:hypothetical protein
VFPDTIKVLRQLLIPKHAAEQLLWSRSSGQGSLPYNQEGASNVFDLLRQARYPADS